jgi:hypothetical protein
MEGRSGALELEPAPKRAKHPTRNEKDRERRRVGGARHAQALAHKQAEVAHHPKGSSTGVLGQMANFKGVAEIIRDYQKSIRPCGMSTSRLTWGNAGVTAGGGSEMRWRLHGSRRFAKSQRAESGPLENEIVRLRAQIADLVERKAGDSESEAERREEGMIFASQPADAELKANAELAELKHQLAVEKLNPFPLRTFLGCVWGVGV